MQLLQLKYTDIYFNLAVEEYLLKEKSDNYFIIWQSDNALVFGKHQNIFEEINLAFAHENNINIARRISGGGTVYHDLGNINFSLILNKEEGKQIDFKQHTKPIFDFLKSLNLNIEYSERHDLFIDNKKISGNAEHVFKNRVLHHGTLFFNTDLEKLQNSLKMSELKFHSKSVKSVSSSVSNISNYLNLSISDFISNLKMFIANYFNIEKETKLNQKEIKLIKNLVAIKYKTDYWLFDYSPKFIFNNKFGEYALRMEIVRGTIETISFTENNLNINKINEIFKNQKYYPKNIENLIITNNLGEHLDFKNEDLIYKFF